MSNCCEVVISGISGRFPECDNLNELKQLLYNCENPITYDDRKWPVNYRYKFGKDSIPYGTGKYKNGTEYDNTIFAVSPVLANQMDIINRRVLEPSFEAIMDAGINPATLMGANVGCFLTCGISEVESVKLTCYAERLSLIGASKGMLSNRVSFGLNLTGPSITFYSPNYGGLDALTYAYENLVNNRIDAAIVGGSGNIVDPKLSLSFHLMNVLSPDGISRVFDAAADGYGRSDGVVILYLQRAQDAKRSYGSLLFCDTLYSGLSAKSLIGIDEEYLEHTLKTIYSNHKNVDPSDIAFLEMDASGVKITDERECNAVAKVFCQKRKQALPIGSVKSNVGNTEAAAGYMSVVKACFALDCGEIAPNANFTNANPNIKSLLDGQLKVVSKVEELKGPIVGVNSITMSGVVSHLVIKQNPRTPKKSEPTDDLPKLLLMCGRMQQDLADIIKKIESEPLNKEFVAITNDIFKTPLPSHIYRGYTVLPASPNPTNGVEVIEGENRPIWFVFAGMGSQWNGMGTDLLRIPIFADTVQRCDKVLRPHGIDIYHILTTDEPFVFDNIVNAFVGIITVQIGLVNILHAIGIRADGIIGHSVGENACAYADGCLTLEQAVLASYARGMASNEAETIKGMMAAIGRGYNQIKDSLPEGIEVACHNSADNCTLTGPAQQVNEFVKKLQDEKIFAKAVNVSNIAYHSRHIRPAAPILLKRLREAIPVIKERSSKWISTSVPESEWNEPQAKFCSAEYLTNNLVSAVLFEEGCRHIPENAIVVEIAPHGLLQAILKRSLRPTNTNISLTLRSKDPHRVNYLLGAIGKLFIAGCQPDVNVLYPKVEYPVSRGTPNTASIATWDHTRSWTAPGILPDRPLSEEVINIKLNKGCEYTFIKAHQVKGQYLIPPSLYMYLTWQILSILRREEKCKSNIVFENIRIHKHLYISIDKSRALSIMIQGSGNFEVLLENPKNPDLPKVVMTGIIYVPYDKINIVLDENQTSKMKIKLNGEQFHKLLETAGYQVEDCFDLVREVGANETECISKIAWNENWTCFLDAVMKVCMYSHTTRPRLLFPLYMRKVVISPAAFEALNPGDEILCKKDLVIDKFCCNGLEIYSFQYDTMEARKLPVENARSDLESLRFVSHSDPKLENFVVFLDFCLQLAVDSLATGKHSETKLHVVNSVHNVSKTLREIVNKNSAMKSQVVFSDAKILSSNKCDRDAFHLVIVNSFVRLNKLNTQLQDKLENLFVLVVSPMSDKESLNNKKAFIQVTKQTFNELPTTNGQLPSVFVADNQWSTKLKPVLKSKNSQPVVFLKHSVELQDLYFMMSTQKQYPNVRCLFIMDDQAPKFSIENPFYKNQILQDFPVAVLKNGQWGTYRNVRSSERSAADELQGLNVPLTDFSLKTVDLRFLSYDCQLVRTNQKTGIKEYAYGLEYSGISDSGKRIMGLGYYNPLDAVHHPEALLSWSIPKHWSLEDASTVPLIYSQVYNMIFVSPISEHFRRTINNIFVNSESRSFTEAFVAVGLYHNINIYVTVGSEADADFMMKKFPCLDRSHLLQRRDGKYELQLKELTNGEGTELVVNCVSGTQHLDATVNCVKIFGQYIDMTDKQYQTGLELGMYVFLQSVEYTTGPHNVLSCLRLPAATKKKLHDFMDEGIKSGVVRPLSRTVLKPHSLHTSYRDEELDKVKEIHKFVPREERQQNKFHRKLQCDEKHSFIIVGGGRKTKSWFELVEWLINRGARRFIVALDNFFVDPKISHQINRLMVQKKATIVLTTSKKAETVEGASSLIREANNIAPLEAIFFISMDVAGSLIDNFDNTFHNEPPCHFINIFSGGLKECERRRQRGLPTLFVYSEKSSQTLAPVLEKLDYLLDHSNVESPLVYQLVDEYKIRKKASTGVELSNFFCYDLDTLINIGSCVTERPKFVEVQTLSRRINESKYKQPVFLIPATDASCMKPIVSKLLYPGFCATFTEHCESATKIAQQLFEDLQRIQPRGPVTVVGETWSGAISIELAALIQAAHRRVELFLIEGSPSTWQKYPEMNSVQFETSLLNSTLCEEREERTADDEGYDWDDNLRRHLERLACSTTDKKHLSSAINGIRERLVMTKNYTFSKDFLNHAVLFKQKPSESSMDKYCLTDDTYLFKTDTYDKFLCTPEMCKVINDNALFSWYP